MKEKPFIWLSILIIVVTSVSQSKKRNCGHITYMIATIILYTYYYMYTYVHTYMYPSFNIIQDEMKEKLPAIN